ncbi:MAG: translocation/assembly module TamB domain-containing protein, partial [Pseudomonadota bacterium]
ASRPQSSLFSDPSMLEADTLAFLITGRPIDQAGSQEGGQIVSAALALGVSNNIATQVQTALGLDQLTLTGTGEDGQVLAGKQLGRRLYLQYAFGIFDKIGSVLLRYQLTDRLTFESESGAEQSLDLIYSVKKP